MITTILLQVLFTFLAVLVTPITALSDAQLPEGLADTNHAVFAYLGGFYSVLPHFMLALFAAFGSLMVIEFFIAFYKSVMWLIKKIPMIN